MGGYISSQSVKKTIEINPYMLGTMAGGAADCQFWHINLGIKGPGLYYVDSERGRLKGTRFSVRSGSPYAYGVLDSGYWFDMSVEEAAELARRPIYHATFRDAASGGVASIYYLGPNGWKKLSGDDVREFHYKYNPVMPNTGEQEMSEVVGA